MHKISPHDWHMFDAELDLEVRQDTNADEENIWAFRVANRPDQTYAMTDEEFDMLRSGDREVLNDLLGALSLGQPES